jgi:hypothetical protein
MGSRPRAPGACPIALLVCLPAMGRRSGIRAALALNVVAITGAGISACTQLLGIEPLTDGGRTEAGAADRSVGEVVAPDVTGPEAMIPMVLATDDGGQPWGIAVSATTGFVYFTDVSQKTINAVPTTGGPVTSQPCFGPNCYSVAVDEDSVFWACTGTNGGVPDSVYQEPFVGTGGPVAIADVDMAAPEAIALTSGSIYWTDSSGDIAFAPIGNSTTNFDYLSVGDDLGPLYGLVVVGNALYYTDYHNADIGMVPIVGNLPVIVTTTNANPYGLATDYGPNASPPFHLYWTTQGGDAGSVQALTLGGDAGPLTLASDQAGPQGIATDGTYVYWTNFDGGTVMGAPVGGTGPAVVLASHQHAPAFVALDSANVYWTNSGDGTVMRVAKPE